MDESKFGQALYTHVVEESEATYRRLYGTTSPSDATDPYFRRALGFYLSLTSEQREIFFAILRQTTVDAVAQVLAVLDGASCMNGCPGEFAVIYDGRQFESPLHEEFLAVDEGRR